MIFLHSHAAHAIIFGRGTTFPSPVKKMLRKFAMLFDFFISDSIFNQEASKSGAVLSHESRCKIPNPRTPELSEPLYFVLIPTFGGAKLRRFALER